MLFSYLNSGYSLKEMLISLLLTVPVVLMSLTVHEVSHGWVSYKLGDPTAHNMGRLTLDPLKHLDPIGTVAMLLFGIGWAKPVPVNARYYKHPKRGMALTALAGPVSNLLLAFLSVIIYAIFSYTGFFNDLFYGFATEGVGYALRFAIYILLYNSMLLNVYLALFNLIPIPPFDGSRIAFALLPDKIYFGVMKYERIIMIVMIVLLYMGVFSTPLRYASDFILNCMLKVVGTVFDGIISVWHLIF